MSPLLSVIVPTRNEAANVVPLTRRVTAVLEDAEWELIFVDDSDDATPDVIAALGDRRVRVLHRSAGQRRGGLSGAVCEGFSAARGDALAVMDGDLQHDPAMLVHLWRALDDVDVVIASRYAAGDGTGGLDGLGRVLVSRVTRTAARLLLRRARPVRDPLAGFFACRRRVVHDAPLRPVGFKILLEVLVRGSWETVRELPYEMSERQAGASNASLREGIRFGTHLLRLRLSS